ncbi:MAG TPA: threonine aldolase [Blastocatellia bacterium]|jgi:threonine aldolase|nr:threonine aldolase [Blastocatellia bacterium]HAF24092.1 threonine aldolase [Blastocatellia bacterium]HCX29105.1 threonine aldolase [Blastocatellia bacterium]
MKNSKPSRSFASDNNAGVHARVMEAMAAANDGHVIAYGDDPYTARAVKLFRDHFGKHAEVYFVFGGTGANVLGLKAVTQPYHAIICAETAHINVDECGAPEKFTGCKLLSVATPDGKIRSEQIRPFLHGVGFEHHVQPRVISVSQATEMGTVYTPRELKSLSSIAHENGMLLHVDGARISNAAASLKVKLRAITRDAGVDILSFGGAKNGMMYGEAVVFFDQNLARDFKYTRKQGTHLPSKMRFISAQFEALLTNELWRQNAEHANRMAQLLADELRKIPQIEITQKVEANGVFALVPKKYIPILQKQYFFYVWNEETSEVRLMTSFDTTEDDLKDFVDLVKRTLK